MKNIIALASIFFVFTTCKKNSSPTQPPTIPVLPSLVTSNASAVTRTNATTGGNITADGGALITVRGICYNTSPTPTTSNSTIVAGIGTGIFSTTILNLTASTTYYVRAYATNSVGTAYGNEISFSTQANSVPSVTTNTTVTTTNTFNTQANGKVVDDGGSPVTARGTCWSTHQTPTIADSKTIDGVGLGSFISTINNLNGNTTYYLRAYATNIQGTAYGQLVTIVTDVEGNIYNTVEIGTQTWMLENLRVGKFNNGTAITNETLNSNWGLGGPVIPMYCWYNNDISNKNLYGGIYNWLCVGTGLLSPLGWHVPTNTDFNLLIHTLDPLAKDTTVIYLGNTFVLTSSNIAGGALREQGTSHWQSPNSGATNSSGFTALPGGWRQSLAGNFDYLGANGGFWTSTQFSQDLSLYILLSYAWNSIPYSNFNGIKQGFSVRCIKD